ncbi:MAG: transferrin-binding protein-like solute binding protein [Gammaproteobacteria bacterium]|nr:transferrin-binding protein-like solute binding protein [Gammaproteobacteria bacterium]
MRTLLIGAIITALTCLSACGGGGGGGSPTTIAPEPSTDPARIAQTRSDLPSAARIYDYLYIHGSGAPYEGFDGTYQGLPGLRRFASPPTVRLRAGMSDRETASAHYAVALINRALPYDLHLRIGPAFPDDYPQRSGTYFRDAPTGELFIEFTEGLRNTDGAPGFAYSDVGTTTPIPTSAQVGLNSEGFRRRPDHQAVSVLVHELLHTLGLGAHVPGDTYPDSNMFDAWFRLDGALPAIDAAALQVLYTRLGAYTPREDLSPAMLGAWEDESMDIGGSIGPVTFGVRHANDVDMPFTAGREPATALADNRALTGTVTWNGKLAGYTASQATVAGDAAISVSLDTMNGRADFSELETGDGSAWGDGDLGYTITVGGNYFRSTGGDAGTVNGQFYGSSHQGAGGSVERADLTAAFGAVR